MADFIQGDSCDDRDLVLRSATCHAAQAFPAEIGVIHVHFSSQQITLLPLGHRPQDLVVQQPGGVVFDAEVVRRPHCIISEVTCVSLLHQWMGAGVDHASQRRSQEAASRCSWQRSAKPTPCLGSGPSSLWEAQRRGQAEAPR